jgi:hypothetical protein
MRRIITVFALLVLTMAAVRASTDDVESLIEKEKVEEQNPPANRSADETAPPAFLLGTTDSVALYSSAVYGGDPSPICESFPFDELIDMSNGDPLDEETVLNMKLPRVRQAVEDSCLIRPGDEVLAVGRGSQSWILIRDFVIRRAPAVCPADSPYSLMARLDHELDEAPLFYSTDPDLKEGDNEFAPVHPLAPVPNATELLRPVVSDMKEYEVRGATVAAANVEALFHLRRRRVTPDDDGFPNEILLWQKGDKIELLTQEAVDSVNGSGSVNVEAVLDYNRDGFLDLWVKGTQRKCPYYLLYQGGEEGFTPVELPNTPCSC